MTRRSAEKLQPLVDSIRAAGGEAHGFGSDARKEDEVAALVEDIESRIGDIDVFVFNIGANVPCSVLDEIGAQVLQDLGNGLLRRLPDRAGRGETHGGTPARHDDLHGRHGEPARCGQFLGVCRGQARVARAGPEHVARTRAANVHVAHVIIDGAIDTAFIRDNFPERYALKSEDGILAPEHIADAYWFLHQQPRDAWTFELDLRPWSERW